MQDKTNAAQQQRSDGFRSGIMIAAILCLLAGCRSYDLTLSEEAEARAKWTVALLPFDDAKAPQAGSDYTFFGVTGGQGSGSVVARTLARAFASDADFSVVDDVPLRQALREEKLAMRECMTDDGHACRLGRRVGATMVIRGRVAAYGTSWFLFFPRSRISLQLQALDPTVSSIIWTATASDHSHSCSERELVTRLGNRIMRDLRAKLVTQEQRGEH